VKIQGTGATGASSSSTRPAGGAGFAVPTPASRSSVAASPMGPVSALGSLDALLALQETPPEGERRRRAVRRAGRMLDALDALKIGLLDGEVSSADLESLKSAVAEERLQSDDPRLQGVLDEIETRAAVELAKRERLGSPSQI